ncbi:MAG TPA: hypothetical protein VF997_10785 [Polyangia bacterium]
MSHSPGAVKAQPQERGSMMIEREVTGYFVGGIVGAEVLAAA